jgi:hypothetical protein
VAGKGHASSATLRPGTVGDRQTRNDLAVSAAGSCPEICSELRDEPLTSRCATSWVAASRAWPHGTTARAVPDLRLPARSLPDLVLCPRAPTGGFITLNGSRSISQPSVRLYVYGNRNQCPVVEFWLFRTPLEHGGSGPTPGGCSADCGARLVTKRRVGVRLGRPERTPPADSAAGREAAGTPAS